MPDSPNIVEFPETFMLQWRPYERMLRERFNAGGTMSTEAVDDMLNRLRPIYLNWARRADAHPDAQEDAPNMLIRVQAWVAEVTTGLLCEIAEREIRLIELGAA